MNLSKHKKISIKKIPIKKEVLFIIPSLLGVSIFFLIPYLDVFLRSFKKSISGDFNGVNNYITVFNNEAFKIASFNTFRFMIICIPLLVSISLFIALILFNNKTLGRYLKSFFLIPMAIPVASIVLLWRVLFDNLGVVNGLIHFFGLESKDLMNSIYSLPILVFSYIWKNLGYDVILWMAGLTTIDKSLYEAAKLDGANEWQMFKYITLPNLKSSLFIIVVLSIVNAFKVFREAYLVAGNYPNENIYMLQHTFNNWFRDLSIEKLSSGAVIMGIVLLFFIIIFNKLIKEK